MFLSEPDLACTPEPLRAGSHYLAHTDAGYEALYDVLLGQGAPQPGPVGLPRVKPPVRAQPLALDPSPPQGPLPAAAPQAARLLPPPGRLALLAGGAALAAAAVGWALWGPSPAPAPGPASALAPPAGPAALQAGPQRVTLELTFHPNPALGPVESDLDPRITVEVPDEDGPLAFVAAGSALRHAGFRLPPVGQKLFGAVQRKPFGGTKPDASTAPVWRTPLCLKTNRTLPADAVLQLRCDEGSSCTAGGDAVSACSQQPTAGLFNLLPSAHAQGNRFEAVKPGEWVVPSLQTLQARQSSQQPAAYSTVRITLDPPSGLASADAVAYELSINGTRLWVDALPTWALAQPWKPGQPVELAFGLENLDAAGKHEGREQLAVRMVFYAQRKILTDDHVTLPFAALRPQPQTAATTQRGVALRWSASYHPTPADWYQLLAHGGGKADALEAKQRFDGAGASTDDGRLLVGVVRQPKPSKPNGAWGLAVGSTLGSGQVRFTFDREAVQALCHRLMQPSQARRLVAAGFKPPTSFNVRVVADRDEDPLRPGEKALIPCVNFSPT